MRTVEDRLAALERSARRWKAATFCVAALAGSAMVLGAQENDPDVQAEVRARKFVLVAPDGTNLGAWAGDADGAGFGMQVRNQTLFMGILPGAGPSLSMDAADRAKIKLLCERTGPGLALTAGESDIKVVAGPRTAALSLKRGPTGLMMGAGTDATLSMQKKDGTFDAVFRKKQ